MSHRFSYLFLALGGLLAMPAFATPTDDALDAVKIQLAADQSKAALAVLDGVHAVTHVQQFRLSYYRADALQRDERDAEAIAELKTLVKTAAKVTSTLRDPVPINGGEFVERGRALLAELHRQGRRFDDAATQFQDLEKAFPSNPEWSYRYGLANLEAEHGDLALYAFDRYLRLHPTGPFLKEASLGRAAALREQRKFQAAFDDLAAAAVGKDVAWQIDAGIRQADLAVKELGRESSEALALCQALIDTYPQHPKVAALRHERARIWMYDAPPKQRDVNAARTELERAIKEFPNSDLQVVMKQDLALTYSIQGQYTEAVLRYGDLLNIVPNRARLDRNRRAYLLFMTVHDLVKLNLVDEARQTATRLEADYPRDRWTATAWRAVNLAPVAANELGVLSPRLSGPRRAPDAR